MIKQNADLGLVGVGIGLIAIAVAVLWAWPGALLVVGAAFIALGLVL